MYLKKVYRLYREENPMVRRIRRKQVQRLTPLDAQLTAPNQEWALDFVADTLPTGRGIRILTLIDSFTRECPALEVDTSLSSRQVTRVLGRVIRERGMPRTLRCDNGPELSPAGIWSAGVKRRASNSSTFSRESPCRTGMWRVSMGDCVTSV